MPAPISVVIVCKNEEHIIGKTIQSVQSVADEIIIYDTGSTDRTTTIAGEFSKTKILVRPWEGYGRTKQKAVAEATHDWILHLDADEILDEVLQHSIRGLSLDDPCTTYRVRIKNYLGNRRFRWGEFGKDSYTPLFNRIKVSWDDKEVHEQLILPKEAKIVTVPGYVLHHSMRNSRDFIQKTVNYAMINAENYFRQGRRAGIIKQLVSPAFTFVKNYIFKLGFLDGWNGLFAARMSALYSYLKYTRLRELWENANLESRNAKDK